MPSDEDIKRVVGRKLQGRAPDAGAELDLCKLCRRREVARKGTVAHRHHLCPDCAAGAERAGNWSTLEIEGLDD